MNRLNGRSTLVFDFDGTLHDSMLIYRRALNRGYAWLVERGEAPERELDDDLISANIGLTAKEAWARMCPDLPWSVTSAAAARVGETMDELIEAGEARLYPGVEAVLDSLKESGHTLVFLSNCRDAYCKASRSSFGLDRWFDRYYTAEQFGGAPKEVIFETVAHESSGPFIAIGDRYKDLALARVHDLPSIGCLYGYGTREELAKATFLARCPEDIPACVERIERGKPAGT